LVPSIAKEETVAGSEASQEIKGVQTPGTQIEAKNDTEGKNAKDVKEGETAPKEEAAAALSQRESQHPFAVAFDTYSENVPVWVWITFLPHLLASLPRPTGILFKSVLAKIATLYPQSIYYPLRTYLLELRIQVKEKSTEEAGLPSTPLSSSDSPMVIDTPTSTPATAPSDGSTRSPQRMADEIMQLLRATYPAVVGKMEEMVKEISRCVAITPKSIYCPHSCTWIGFAILTIPV